MLKMIQQLLQKMNLKCHISYLEPLLKERLYRLILISLYSSADESVFLFQMSNLMQNKINIPLPL